MFFNEGSRPQRLAEVPQEHHNVVLGTETSANRSLRGMGSTWEVGENADFWDPLQSQAACGRLRICIWTETQFILKQVAGALRPPDPTLCPGPPLAVGLGDAGRESLLSTLANPSKHQPAQSKERSIQQTSQSDSVAHLTAGSIKYFSSICVLGPHINIYGWKKKCLR